MTTKNQMRILSALIITLFFSAKVFSCTTFVISGKATPDGKPIFFKNRDADQKQNSLAYFTDGKYKYIGVVNGDEDWNTMV
ncbi:MAG: hypothetical protein KKG93_11815 [Bacteroidetes bacterium]|nr:hypothetical protein [Bacteroidota bacterium]